MAAPLIIAATAASTVGALYGGAQQASSYNQQAAAAEQGAAAGRLQARQAYDAGTSNEVMQRRQAAQQLGAQRAAVAESGFNPNSGSALQVQRDSAINAEMDALQTRYEGLLRGNAFDQQARQDEYQAKVLRSSAKNARTSSYVSAAAAALSGATAYGSLSKAASAGSGVASGGGGLGLRIQPTGFWRP